MKQDKKKRDRERTLCWHYLLTHNAQTHTHTYPRDVRCTNGGGGSSLEAGMDRNDARGALSLGGEADASRSAGG